MNTDNTESTAVVPVKEYANADHMSSEFLFPIMPTPRSDISHPCKRRINIREYFRDFALALLLGLAFFGAGAFAVIRELTKILS